MVDLLDWLDTLTYRPDVGANDIIGWVLPFFGGLIVYNIVDGFQTRVSRHTMTDLVENKINMLFSTPLGLKFQEDEERHIFLRTLLDDHHKWGLSDKDFAKVIGEQRYVMIRSYDEDGKNTVDYISTQAVHELVVLFRRIEKLYKDRILKPIDLADLWREILPFSKSGRPDFLSSYLSEEDLESMWYIIIATVHALMKHKNETGIKYFMSSINNQDLISGHIPNDRFRKRDILMLKRVQRRLKI